jgi:1,4-dihydroxy-2-naphthoate octaprenyltransferase
VVTPFVIGACGALVIILYSCGPKPISYLPFGEIFSGAVMGLGIAAGVFSVLAGGLSGGIFVLAVPFAIAIGLIMMTNNACDIERDAPAGRRTLTVLLGRRRSRALYRALVILWYISVPVFLTLFSAMERSHMNLRFLVSFPLLLACLPLVIVLMRQPLTPDTRARGMKAIVLANAALGGVYCIGVIV